MKLTFSVFGDFFDPTSFTRVIGIEPTKSWVRGAELSYNKKNTRQESAWEYCIEMDTLFFEDITGHFEIIFNNYIDTMSEYAKKNCLSMKFEIVIEILDQQSPALFINRNFLNLSCKLEAELDIDIYVV